jgi:hypothetical protein
VGIEPSLLLERMAATMRGDIAPAVGDGYARTQAYMASVILAKLAVQLATAEQDAAAAAQEHGAVARAVRAVVTEPPADLAAALDALDRDGATARWNELVATLHAARPDLDAATWERAMGIVRTTLRARLDRALRAAR